MYASSVSNSLRTKQPMVLCHDDVTENSMAFWLIAFEGEILIFKIINPCVRLTCEPCFMVNSCLKDVRKIRVSRKAVWGYVPLPRGPWLILSVCETPRLDWDKGRGHGLVTRGVFLGSGMFSVWNSFCADFQREAVIPETGKCYKQYGNTRPLLMLLLPSVVAKREYTQLTVCVCL